MSKRILVISHDKIGASMAGPGIRYHHIAKTLSAEGNTVTVGFFDKSYIPDSTFEKTYESIFIDRQFFDASFKDIDVVISMWLSDDMIRYCKSLGIFIIFDVYAPTPVENLTLFLLNGFPANQATDLDYRQSYIVYNKFFSYGDLFLFSNRRQSNFWTGYVFGSGQVSVSSYHQRPFFDRFINAPMGIDLAQLPKDQPKRVIKGVIKGIKETDKVILWTGGIWNWFDAQTLIRAMEVVKKSNPEIKLVFLGTKHPNPNVPSMQETVDTYNLAVKLKLINKNVFFNDGWVPYSERINYLLESDAAVSITKSDIEAEFSHRTRVLDHFLTALPTISTIGDYLTDNYIVPKNMGYGIKRGDYNDLADKIIEIMKPAIARNIRDNISKYRDEFSWDKTLKPLVSTIKNLPDRLTVYEPTHPLEVPKNSISPKSTLLVKVAKKVLPVPIKKIILKIIKND